MTEVPGSGVRGLAEALPASSVATPLAEAIVVEVGEHPAHAATRLATQGLDQAPVLRRKTLIGWASTEALRRARTVKEAHHRLEDSRFAGSASSINDVLPHLAGHGLCFTVGRRGIEGFIVPSDLDRHAARTHFYLLVSSVEMLLSSTLRKSTDADQLVHRISTHRVRTTVDGKEETLRSMYEEARNAGLDAHPVEYLYLRELVDAFCDRYPVSTEIRRRLNLVCDLRTDVMHPTRPLARKGAAQLASAASAAMSLQEDIPAAADRRPPGVLT